MQNECPLEWLFFDVGNVLMDESAWLAHYQELVYAALREMAPGLTREQFEQERLQGGVRKDVTVVQHILARFLPDPAARDAARKRFWTEAVRAYYDLSVPADGIFEALEALRPRFRMGVIANQHPPIRAWMERAGLAPYFTLAVYDCDLGFSKPDPRLFACALERAGCAPGRAVMIGDRLDNDIRPALALSMWTVHVRAYGDYARMEPSGPDDTPHAAVSSVRELPAAVRALCREAAGASGPGPAVP